jgi:hypothetical protein
MGGRPRLDGGGEDIGRETGRCGVHGGGKRRLWGTARRETVRRSGCYLCPCESIVGEGRGGGAGGKCRGVEWFGQPPAHERARPPPLQLGGRGKGREGDSAGGMGCWGAWRVGKE